MSSPESIILEQQYHNDEFKLTGYALEQAENASKGYKAPTPTQILNDPDVAPIDLKTSINKYDREIKPNVYVDVYDVLKAFNVTNPATAHAIKKLLAGGKRGYKDVEQDLKEAISSINRAIELETYNNKPKDN